MKRVRRAFYAEPGLNVFQKASMFCPILLQAVA